MWWQYVVTVIATLFVALIAVRFDHWLSGRNEYRKAIKSLKHEIAVNIASCDATCKLIDADLEALQRYQTEVEPYHGLHESSWSNWESVIVLRSPELADKIEEAYLHVPPVNNLLHRIEENKWGPLTATAMADNPEEALRTNLEKAKSYISEILLPRLKEAKKLLEEEG